MGAERKIASDPAIIDYIIEHREKVGVPPSIREAAEHFGVSKSTVQNALARMFDEGLLRRAPGVARGITISEAGMKMISEEL